MGMYDRAVPIDDMFTNTGAPDTESTAIAVNTLPSPPGLPLTSVMPVYGVRSLINEKKVLIFVGGGVLLTMILAYGLYCLGKQD